MKDLIAMGRINVDFYPNEMNVPFNEIVSFRKSIGGSPANIAVGAARLGLKTGFIGKVSGDQFGTFILDFFRKEKIDVSNIRRDTGGAMNCVAFTEVKSPQNCSAVIYRDNVADLKIDPDDIDEAYIKDAKILLISGTALSKSPSREAVYRAIEYANKNETAVFLDLDYRANAWTAPSEASLHYRNAAGNSNVIIGTKEEIDILNLVGEKKDDNQTAEEWLNKNAGIVIIKYGKDGSTAFLKNGEKIEGPVFRTTVKKTYGAGDAYASAFIFGYLQNWEIKKCLEYAAASASIVISKDACAESSPTENEIRDFIAKGK